MNTPERAIAIAKAAEPFRTLLGSTTADDLLAWLRAELGNSEALDRWVDHGEAKTKAITPETILHVVSGNTPHAALQSLIGGLLLGSRNLVKLPRGGLTEVDEFVSGLPEALRKKVETAEELPSDWLTQAEAVIVYGSDETVAHFRNLVSPAQVFVGHG
ncbi:MAG: acyl-CoA reductase, partial [Chthoniobacterales bacterium]